jgi:hypothetical protein
MDRSKQGDKPPTVVRCPGVVKPNIIINNMMTNEGIMVSQILEGILNGTAGAGK